MPAIDPLALLDLADATGMRTLKEAALFLLVAEAPGKTTRHYADAAELPLGDVTTILGGLADNDRRKAPLGLLAQEPDEKPVRWTLTKKGRKAVATGKG